MAVRTFDVEPSNDKVGQLSILVDPGTGYSPTVDATGALKVSGAGSGQSTAANQALQLTQETLAAARLTSGGNSAAAILASILAKIIAAPATEASAAAILAATQTDILALSDPIAVTATTTLSTMLGVALNASLKQLTLISSDTTKIVYWALGGAASAATAVLLPVGAASVELRVSKTVADTLQFFAPASVDITVLQEG